MSQPFIGSIMLFAGNFAVRGYAKCDGQLMSIAQNDALFALIGTTYGGDGVNTFALPDLRGRIGNSVGQGAGLSNYDQGQSGGTEAVSLTTAQLPAHTHALNAQGGNATTNTPGPTTGYARAVAGTPYAGAANLTTMAATALAASGGGSPHNNLMPYLTINFQIALEGIFPSRN